MRFSKENFQKKNKVSKKVFLTFLVFSFGLLWGISTKEFLKQVKANLQLLAYVDIFSLVFEKNDLPTIEYEISFKNFSKISIVREKAVSEGILRRDGNDYVAAKVRNSESEDSQNCKIRLKGDLSWHWSGKKWSLRTEVKKGETILGRSKFSIQPPSARNCTYEWLYLETLRKHGVIAPSYEFCNVLINGKKMGIYAIEEHFSKHLIEGQQRREGVILAFDEHAQWNTHWNIDWQNSYRTSPINIRDERRVNTTETLKTQRDTAIHLIKGFQNESLQPDQVFDTEILGKYLAISHIWGAEHGFSYADINFYYNPITAKLEPIGMDGKPSPHAPKWVDYFSLEDLKEKWIHYALSSPQIAYQYIKYLDKFSCHSYIKELKKQFHHEELKLRNLLLKDLLWQDHHSIWNNKQFLIESDPWNIISKRCEMIRDGISSKKIANLHSYINVINKQNFIEVKVVNQLTQPIEVKSLSTGRSSWNARSIINPKSAFYNNPIDSSSIVIPASFVYQERTSEAIFQIPLNKDFILERTEQIVIVTVRIFGTQQTPLRFECRILEQPNNDSKLPFFRHANTKDLPKGFKVNGNQIWIESGTYHIHQDLKIPPGFELSIEKGTTLKFASESVFISESSIKAIGERNSPIKFTSLNDNWGGMLVFNTQNRSIFEFVSIDNTTGIGLNINKNGLDRKGWFCTGGVTFYRAGVDMADCSFSNSVAEDALNIVSSDFSINRSDFSNHESDGFDGDFVKGEVSDCNFSEIKGDAVDFSGSEVTISGLVVRSVIDKGVSAGEETHLSISNSRFENIGYGLVSKDSSKIISNDMHIVNAQVAGMAAYIKKPNFKPAIISAQNTSFVNCAVDCLSQTGSRIHSEGLLMPRTSFQSKTLYDN